MAGNGAQALITLASESATAAVQIVVDRLNDQDDVDLHANRIVELRRPAIAAEALAACAAARVAYRSWPDRRMTASD